jgi:hypothetical protein
VTFRRWPAALVLFCVALTAPVSLAARAAAPNVSASHYDVTIDLRADGSLDVVERITLKVGSTPITWFERHVPDRRTDGLTGAVAMMDGRVMPALTDGVGVRIRQRSGIDARWQFEPIANRERTFELRYRALRVVPREPAGPHLLWTALPAKHDYPIDAARVTLRAPNGTLAVAVSANGGDIQTATSWQDGLVVTGSGLRANDSISLDVTFSADTIHPAEPEWATAAEHAQKLAPAFIAGGITLLVIGAGTLAMIRVRTLRSIDLAAEANWPADAADAPPAVAAALIGRGQTRGWLPLQAAFFRLVRDGSVVVTKSSERRRFRGPTFTVTLGPAVPMTMHERWIIDGIASQSGSVELRRLTTMFMQRQRGFHTALHTEMMTLGLLDADRVSTTRGLTAAGMVLMLLSLVAAGAVAALLVDRLGPALLAMPAGVFVDAIAFLIAGSAMSNLSEPGERAAARWRARVTELRQVMRLRGAGYSLQDFERWLPLAIGAGFGAGWLKAFDTQLAADSGEIAWIKTMGSVADARATMAMVIAISGASHAGGAGAGAGAGGGSSGAG